MIVHDPLYGAFELPDYLERLVAIPEVRRLSGVRLLNTLSPSLATLGELRRYSHTLGVLHLALLNASRMTTEERRALHASVLLHDIGTPPFGHLLEYHLADASSWSHESVIRDVMWGLHAPENTAHQFFAGRTIAAREEVEHAAISVELVMEIVEGRHRLSRLLFGTMDLDNLDNVARMAWSLGLGDARDLTVTLAAALDATNASTTQLPRVNEPLVADWLELRKRIYGVLAFDRPTLAAQAVLSRAIKLAMDKGELIASDWPLTDEEFLARLRDDPELRDLINLEYLGRLPQPVFVVQVQGSLRDLGLATRSDATTIVEEVAARVLESNRVLGYVFQETGVFDRRLEFNDPSGGPWSVGAKSQSVIMSAFLRSPQAPSIRRCKRVVAGLIERLDLPHSKILRWSAGDVEERADGQEAIAFTFG